MTTATVPAAGAPASGAPTVAPRARGNRETWVALGFILPTVFGFLVFYLWPSLRGFGLSFTDYQFFADSSFVGLDNYQRIVTDETFWNAMLVTVWYVVLNIGFQTVLAVLLAVLLHRLTRSVVIRGLVLMPYLVANVVIALLWFWMLDAQIGVVNQILSWFGIGSISFFGSEAWAIPTIAFVNTWRHLGYTALLIFAGLVMIPRMLYEAGRVDGASEWQMFWRVTLPLLRPVLALVLVITVVGSFQVFDTVAVTTLGGPADASRVIQYYIYDLAFERLDYGYASAVSVVLLVILSVIAFVQLRLMRANESDLA
jgi:multiple sugar transport system permease protein